MILFAHLKGRGTRASKVRLAIVAKEGETNDQCFGDSALLKREAIARSMNKMARVIDAMKEERRYLQDKFLGKDNLADATARIDLKGIQLVPSAIKCHHSMNDYKERYGKIDNLKCKAEFPRCSEKEAREHIIQCEKTMHLKIKLTVGIRKELKRAQPEGTSNEAVRDIAINMQKYLRGEEDAEYETSQEGLGMKQLFQGFIMN